MRSARDFANDVFIKFPIIITSFEEFKLIKWKQEERVLMLNLTDVQNMVSSSSRASVKTVQAEFASDAQLANIEIITW